MPFLQRILRPASIVVLAALASSFFLGRSITPHWTLEQISIDLQHEAESGRQYFLKRGKPVYVENISQSSEAVLTPGYLDTCTRDGTEPALKEEFVYELQEGRSSDAPPLVKQHIAKANWGPWSLFPAVLAILLCWITKEPVTALLGGITSGAFILGLYDLTDQVLIPNLQTKSAAGVLILYLWLLGGLLGIWSRTGAARAFAEFMSTHFVRGPVSARLVAWFLGVVFFQGGTVSTVLVGTSVKPLSDQHKVSHEELAYIVDSTASPIASQLAFNAWPGYVQAFIFVAGVPWLATEADRIAFFFKSVPFCFYAIFAVLGTFLLAINKAPFLNKRLKAAIERSRETGELDALDAQPLSARELQTTHVPEGYRPSVWEFFLPLGLLIGVAIGTFIVNGSPQVRWAFGGAILLAAVMALVRGMKLLDLMVGFTEGLKGVVLGSVILMLAMTLGATTKELGAGNYLVDLLGTRIPFWILPVLLQLLTMLIAFSTGTSWGTYAVTFPLAMPLAWSVAQHAGLEHPMLFMTICFATVMDGSVYGDQCSPISDTTILSSMCCGCDLMDHVKTQIPQATLAAGLAAVCWTLCAAMFC